MGNDYRHNMKKPNLHKEKNYIEKSEVQNYKDAKLREVDEDIIGVHEEHKMAIAVQSVFSPFILYF